MKVRMTVEVSGTRDGQPWPPAGAIMEMSDTEARDYINAGMAIPVTTLNEAERAVKETFDVETRTEVPTVTPEPAPRPTPPRLPKDLRGPSRR